MVISKLEAFRENIFSRKYLLFKLIFLFILIVPLVFLLSSKFNLLPQSSSSSVQDNRVKIQAPLAQSEINKELSFPILDKNGKEVSKIIYTVENAELRNEIIVKGQKATAISGRIFFILNLKIKNESDKRIQVNTRDYIRLSINGNDQELLAADIHNDPVEIQPKSIKRTRIGFPINDANKNLKLFLGEIKGEKTTIDLKF